MLWYTSDHTYSLSGSQEAQGSYSPWSPRGNGYHTHGAFCLQGRADDDEYLWFCAECPATKLVCLQQMQVFLLNGVLVDGHRCWQVISHVLRLTPNTCNLNDTA